MKKSKLTVLLLNIGFVVWLVVPETIFGFTANDLDFKQEFISGPKYFNDSLPEDSTIYQLDEVVVSAFNRTQKLIEVPGSLSYLGAILIEREKPDFTILPLLSHAPGVFAHIGATNTSRVSIRGIGARVPYATGKIRAYFNNIPLTNASGFSFIQDIDPSVVESMEIVKGPATSVYGAGLGGTITMNARKPGSRKTGLNNTSQIGSFGMFRNSLVADLVENSFASSLVYSHTQSEGYRENNEFRRDAITSVSQFKMNKKSDLTALLSFSDLRSFIPSSIDSLTFINSPRSAAANWLKTRGYEDSQRFLGGLDATAELNERINIGVSVFSIWHKEKEMRPFDVFYEERFTIGSRFKANYTPGFGSGKIDFTAGGELFLEEYHYSNFENISGEGQQGVPFSRNRETVNTFSLFAQTDIGLNRLKLSGGVNLNYTDLNYSDLFHEGALNQSGNYSYGFIISPRISANYLYHSSNSIFATLSHGFAPPSLAETLTPDGFINPDIRPEKSWSMEMGFRGNLLEKKLFYDFGVFHMQVQDLLVAERVGGDAWVGKNAGESIHQGVEAELHWVLLRNFISGNFLWNEISLRSNYTYSHFRFTDFIDRDNDYSGNKIPGVPDHVIFLSLYGSFGNGLYFMPMMRRVGSMIMNDLNTKSTQPYFIADLTVGFKKPISVRWDADIFIKAGNILNQKYASMILVNAPSFGNTLPRYYYPGLPINFAFGVRAGFR